MKEIDINIEGYNVNGICVGCLNYNRKMSYGDKIKDCFKILGDIDVPDGLSIQVCWECRGAVEKAMGFRELILKSYDILRSYSKQHTFLNSPTDLSKHSQSHLSTSNVLIDYLENKELNAESDKEDIEVKSEHKDDTDVYKDELDLVKKEENESDQDEVFQDDFQQAQDSSDDDLQLSQLKVEKGKKKGKRGGKKKREGSKPTDKPEEDLKRKSKSLPDDLVEVYTMTEMEMWAMRAADLASKEFASKKYKCELCLFTFNTERLMNEHLTGKHVEKGEVCYKCDICKAYFLSKDHVSCHRCLHLTGYRCRVCGEQTSMRRKARQHAATHRQACGDCGENFSSRSKLFYHRSKVHKEKLQCDCCGKVFATKMTLKFHLKTNNPVKEATPKEQLFLPCRGCSKVFHSKKSYQAHVVIHNGVKYPCPTCGKLFQWKRNLARHARNHRERDQGNSYECRPCNKSFSSRECYANHMRLSKKHVPEDAYAHACMYCGKKFATKWCMVDHIDWDHLKRFKYQCSVCFKPFKTAKIMVTHMRNIHEGGKKKEAEGEHLCEVCGKSYKTVKRLKGHVWSMHTNRSTAKSFKCKLCPATFTWQTSIYKHMKMMHDHNKRIKAERKKQDPYPEIELANRMQYFQQNIVQNVAHTTQQVPVGVVQNIG